MVFRAVVAVVEVRQYNIMMDVFAHNACVRRFTGQMPWGFN